MANSDKDILITPNSGSSTVDPKIEYVGADSSANDTITVETQFDGSKSTLSFEGSAGQLFSVSNDLSGTLFAVNDGSGIPSIEVDSDGEIRLAEFSGNVGIGISSPTELLHVDGRIKANNLTLSSLSAQNSEATAVMIDGSGIIGTRELGSNAFNSTSYLTGNQTITLSGDVSGSGTTSISVTIADDSHNHVISNVDGLQTALDAKAPVSTTVTTNGAQTISAIKTHTSRLALSAGQMLSLGDTNHHLVKVTTGYSGSTVDGPRLQGHQGGELATNINSNQYSLRWDSAGNIHVRGDGKFNGTKIEGDGKEIVRFNDLWLRLNPDNDFSSGIYCGTGLLRTDGTFQVGASGAKFAVNGANGNVSLAGTLDGRDIAADGTKLDTIATNADVTPSWVPSSNPSYATQSYVGTQISNLVDSSPSTLNTLNELAAALGDDANFSTTVTNSIATKAPIASPSFTTKITTPSIHHTGAISVLNGSSAQGMKVASLYVGTSYSNSAASGQVNTLNGYRVRGTEVINSSGNWIGGGNISEFTNNSGYVTASTTSLSNYMRLNATADVTNYSHVHTFYTNGNIATPSGAQSSLQCYNATAGNDAFMTFHVGGDFACYFGLDGGTNKLSVGGWSMGANSYEIYHSGNKPSLATLGFTGASNANYITNNNQLTNGAGYLTASSTQSKYVRSDTADTASGQITFSAGGVFATNGVRVYRQNTNSTIWFNGSSAVDANHALWNAYYGTSPTTRGAANSGFDGIYWNTYRGIHIRGGSNGAVDCIKVTNSSGSVTDHTVTLYASNVARLATNTSGVSVTGNIAVSGTVDGRDVATDGSKLDGIASSADVTPSWVPASNPSYLTSSSTQSKYLRSDTSDQHTSGQITFNGGIHIGSTNTYIVQHVTNGLGFRVGTGNYYGLKIDPTAGHTETIKTGVGGAFNALQGVLQVKGDQTMNRGSIIRWANDGGGTGEYIHSKAASPYDVCIHSGGYDGIQVPNTGSVRINHNGAQKFVTTSTGVSITGALVASGNITAYSDRKKKKNIRDLESASKYLNSINPKRFAWKDTEKEDIGFIAQDVEEAGLSEFVSDSPAYNSETALEEGIIKTLDYGKMVSVLWGAVKEQQETINKLTNRINDLEKGE